MGIRGFYKPGTAEEAARAFAAADGNAFYLNGGTDVLVAAREKDTFDGRLAIDISDLQELKQLCEGENSIFVGAGCTHSTVAASALIKRYASVLAAACAEVGSPQIRNRGTIGGNIANASPAADTLAPLALLNARLTLRSAEGMRELALQQVVTGPYQTALVPGELITKIQIDKLPPGERQCFIKLGRRKALAISRLTVCVAGAKAENGCISDLRIALGSAFPQPLVFPELNAQAIGQKPTAQLLALIAEATAAKLPEIAGVRSSTRYKQPVSRLLLARALGEVFEVSIDE